MFTAKKKYQTIKMFTEERLIIKKRKVEVEFFTFDLLFEITKFINNISDFLRFAQVNKYLYNLLLIEDNIILNELFKRNKINLTNNLPNYLFKLKNLNLSRESDFNLLNYFTNLQYLYVEIIHSKYLNNLNNLINLEELKINYCGFDLSKLINLKKLSAYLTKNVTDDFLINLTNLTKLRLYGYKPNLTGKFLQNMKQLKILKCSSSLVEDKYLSNLNNLTKLDISSCYNIKGSTLQNLTQLKTLYIQNSAIENYNDSIGKLINLTFLNVTTINDNDLDTSFLLNLINLKTLFISICNDKDLHNLKNLRILKIFNGKCTSLLGKCFKYLINLKELEGNFAIEGQYFKYLTNLNILKLKEINTPFTVEDFAYIKNIKELQLSVPINVTDLHLQTLTNIVDLNLSKSKSINGDCLQNLVNLKFLNASETNIKDEHLINLIKLFELDIANCKNIIGTCFLYIKQLEILFMNGAINIKEEYLDNLINLSFLFINDCPNLIYGKFLLQMNKLEQLNCNGSVYFDEIEEFKNQIRNGNNLRDAIDKILND